MLRLVSRAARDDFVDGRATRVQRLWADAPLSALSGVAPRLRSLASLSLGSCRPRFERVPAPECAALASMLERLPARGAALCELRLHNIVFLPRGDPPGAQLSRSLERVAAAIGQLSGLTALQLNVRGLWVGGAAALLGAAARLPALARLDARLFLHGKEIGHPYDVPPPPLPPLQLPLRAALQGAGQRWETLRVGGVVATSWLPLLFEAQAAAALTRLRDLHLDMKNALPADLPPAPWRAPWLSQLTRLAVGGAEDHLQRAARALAPRALPALRALEVRPDYYHDASAAQRRAVLSALLAACDAAALEALAAVHGACAAAAAGLPSLRALTGLDGFWDGGSAGLGAFAAAPLAPLTRLELDVARCIGHGGRGLEPLFTAPWAASLRGLSLWGLYSPDGASEPGDSPAAMRALRGLSALSALTALSLVLLDAQPAALEAAAANGVADGWAPRLKQLQLRTPRARGAAAARALLRLPLRALERLDLAVDEGQAFGPADLAALAAACGAALPRLTALEVSADKAYRLP